MSPCTFDQIAHPEKHGLVECPHCAGYGSSLKEPDPKCTACGGSGLMTPDEVKTYQKRMA